MDTITQMFRKGYNRAIHSLAFFPLLIMLGFLGLAIISLELDANGFGEKLNKKVSWLTLKDAATATTIAATVASGIISIMVFSFSMVMVVMNQAASQMSNRMIDNLIGGKLQKLVLSFYIGTIAFAFLLLSNVSDGTEKSVPVLSTYFLIFLAIVDIFFFISFLNYITESIRYEQLIQKVHQKAKKTLRQFTVQRKAVNETIDINGQLIAAQKSGYFQGFSRKPLLQLCTQHGLVIRFLEVKGDYLLKGSPLFELQAPAPVSEKLLKQIFKTIDFYYGQEIDKNPYYGFLHLMEVGIKALSPGINDPGTAVFSLHALSDLLLHKMQHEIPPVFCDAAGEPRIISKERSFEELFYRSVLPIWDYGRKDRIVQEAMLKVLTQLQRADAEDRYSALFTRLKEDVLAAKKEMAFTIEK